MLCLCVYLSVYWLLAGWFFHRYVLNAKSTWWKGLGISVIGAFAWVALEWVRATFLTGFSWNGLAISQYKMTPLIQLAEYTGVFGISFMIILMNIVFARYLLHIYITRQRSALFKQQGIGAVILVIVVLALWGRGNIKKENGTTVPVQIACVQTNISQYEKWTAEFMMDILRTLNLLTVQVADPNKADLIIWPETSLPQEVRYDETCLKTVYHLARKGVPLLVGTVDVDWDKNKKGSWYNSSFLFNTKGEWVTRYHKQHLVLFGEYAPFREVFPFMGSIVPFEENFSSGEGPVIFSLNDDIDFSSLICFESTVAKLSRESVKLGSRLLVNQTNDAWFENTPGQRQHLTQLIFRAVENAVPIIRCSNSGVNCYINEHGFIVQKLVDENGKDSNTEAVGVFDFDVPVYDFKETFYTKYGDLFAYFSLCISLGYLVFARKKASFAS